MHLEFILQISSLSSGLSQCFDIKKKKKTNTIFKNKTHTLKLEGPGGSALIASIVLAVPHESLLQLFLKLLLSFSILVHPCG